MLKLGLGLSATMGRGSGGTPGPLAMLTRGYSLGIISDPHIGTAIHDDYVATCLAWLIGRARGLVGILACGDLVESPEDSFNTWLRDPESGNVPTSIPLFPVPGNHDAEIGWGGPYEQTPDQPHATLVSRYAGYFRGREWYSVDHEALRIMAINNLTDYLSDAGYSTYYNNNPPGYHYALNPDHSGISIPGSAQRAWLDAQSASRHLWKIIAGHRSLWAPYDTDPRKLNRLARPAMATPIDRGVSLIVTGDIHVGSFSGPWYPTAPDYEEYRSPGSVGAYSLTLAGSYFPRDADPDVLPNPETTLHWSSGTGVSGSGLCHAALLTFQGDVAYLEVFECSNSNPTGAIVFTHTLLRNPGGS